MKLIELSKTGAINKGKYFAQVDDADFDWLNRWHWNVELRKKGTPYAVRFITENGKRSVIRMHRLILGISDKSIFCDHKDHNGLNNQRENLREATYEQNNRNTKSPNISKNRYKGVLIRKYKLRVVYSATIGYKNKKICLGVFDSAMEAAIAYDKKAIELYKEFASLNFPDPIPNLD